MTRENYQPWDITISDFWRQETAHEKLRFLLKFAVLAPSTHNSQPWKFKLQDNAIEIYADKSFILPQADKTGRDLYISLGCLIENIFITASFFNVFKDIDYLPEGDSDLVARVYFSNLNKQSMPQDDEFKYLFEAIPERHTARGEFKDKKVEDEVFGSLESITLANKEIKLHLVKDKNKINQLAKLTAHGLKLAYKSSSFRKEMSNWINNNLSDRKEGIHGYAFRLPTLLSLIFPSLVRSFDMGVIVSKINYRSAATASFVGIISADKDSKRNWLDVGRMAQRALLNLQSHGLSSSIFVSSIEMGDLYKQVKKIIKTNNRPQFLFCGGYMDGEQKKTPRHSIDDKIIQ